MKTLHEVNCIVLKGLFYQPHIKTRNIYGWWMEYGLVGVRH